MGGKGIRRREKNYKAAHSGGNTSRLPPPPVPSSIDALPSKLRKLISFTGTGKQQLSHGKRNTGDGADKGARSGEGTESTTTGMKRKRNDQTLMAQDQKHGDEDPEMSNNEKKKKKKANSKKVHDLRFETLDKAAAGAGSRRKERKKQLLEARKKKHKKPRTEEEEMEFPGCEDIKFGEVVEAPPKLTNLPKVFKATQVASQERLRLQAVDAYRKRKGWESRPGVQLPSPMTTSLFP